VATVIEIVVILSSMTQESRRRHRSRAKGQAQRFVRPAQSM
jgi:hypothetical protein